MITELHWLLWRMRRAARRQLVCLPQKLSEWHYFWTTYRLYRKLMPTGSRSSLSRHLTACLADNTTSTPVDPNYLYQNTWAFSRIADSMPVSHIDVGSDHTFVALLSRIVPVTMVDIRPLPMTIEGLRFKQGTILDLPYPDSSLPSLSSMCVVEHIGLGRYGDPLDVDGSEKAIRELKRVVAAGGDLYISLPIDDENRTYFNAHRAFRSDYLEKLFQPFVVKERRFIYGKLFTDQLQKGFGTVCYHLRRSS